MPMQKLYIKKLLEMSKKFQRKYYYENVLANENITVKTNISWVADITEIELDKQKKLHVFLCVDIHSNNIK